MRCGSCIHRRRLSCNGEVTEWFTSTPIFPMTVDGSPVFCLLLIFRCRCPLHSGGCSVLIIVLVPSGISLLLGPFCGRFLVFSVTIPLYFIHSCLSSDITHCRLWSVLGLVTSCIPLLLFVVSCHSSDLFLRHS